MVSNIPEFLRLKQADHDEARNLPYVRALVDYLSYEINCGNNAALLYVGERNHDRAYYARAKAEALEELFFRMHLKDPPEPEAEPEFVDEAMPPSLLKGSGDAGTE